MVIRWVPTSYQLAAMLIKTMSIPPVLAVLLNDGLCSLVQTEEDSVAESRRAELRHGQRQRRKARSKAIQASASWA